MARATTTTRTAIIVAIAAVKIINTHILKHNKPKKNLFGGIEHEIYGEIPVQKCNMEYMTMLRLSGICIAIKTFNTTYYNFI